MVIKRWKELSHGGMVSVPSRLYRAIPAVLLGILLNTLDAGESSDNPITDWTGWLMSAYSLYRLARLPLDGAWLWLREPTGSSHISIHHEVSGTRFPIAFLTLAAPSLLNSP